MGATIIGSAMSHQYSKKCGMKYYRNMPRYRTFARTATGYLYAGAQ
jgi:hypothetical protein